MSDRRVLPLGKIWQPPKDSTGRRFARKTGADSVKTQCTPATEWKSIEWAAQIRKIPK